MMTINRHSLFLYMIYLFALFVCLLYYCKWATELLSVSSYPCKDIFTLIILKIENHNENPKTEKLSRKSRL